MQRIVRLSLMISVVFITACSTQKNSVSTEEAFTDATTYSRVFPVESTVACQAVQRTFLGQGYIITGDGKSALNASKKFQPMPERHVDIQFHVVCSPNSDTQTTTIFVNAIQDTYALKKTNNSASVGVGVLGSLSMPIGSSDDSLVRVASETIRTPGFYERFYNAVSRVLPAPPPPSAASKQEGEE